MEGNTFKSNALVIDDEDDNIQVVQNEQGESVVSMKINKLEDIKNKIKLSTKPNIQQTKSSNKGTPIKNKVEEKKKEVILI